MKKTIKYIILILITCLIPIGTKYGISYAKYAYNSVWNYYLSSKAFYFDSNTLKENNGKITNNLWDGDRIYFDVKNNLNDFLSSEYDISYKVTCTVKESSSETSCRVMDQSSIYEGILSTYKKCYNETNDGVDVKNLDKATCEMKGYSWINVAASKDLYFDLTNKVDHAVVELNVTSTSPYKKTLKAEFALNRDYQKTGTIIADYKDQGEDGNLILTNSYEENKCVRINWDSSDLRLDFEPNTVKTYATDTEGYINEIDIKLEPTSSHLEKFYEANIKNYSKSDFIITEIEECN